MSRHLRFDKYLFYNILEASSTWVCVVVEEEEKDGEGDGACEDASKTLDIPDEISKDIAYLIKLPNCQFGEGLLRLGPLNVFHGVDCEDADCDEKPGDLQSPRIIHDRFSLAMFS